MSRGNVPSMSSSALYEQQCKELFHAICSCGHPCSCIKDILFPQDQPGTICAVFCALLDLFVLEQVLPEITFFSWCSLVSAFVFLDCLDFFHVLVLFYMLACVYVLPLLSLYTS